MNIPPSSKKRIVIIGGGFGGLSLAKGLKNSDFQVVLIDKHNYHVFQPLLYQVATAGLEPGSIAYPFRKIFSGFSNFFFRMAQVESILTEKKTIVTNIGSLTYDYLVIATGATSNYFGNTRVEERSMPMKSVSEALDIRSLLLQNFERAILSKDLKEREALMSVVIVGGGPTGVELAGAIAELRKDILPKDYPDLDIRGMDIHLIEANSRLLKVMNEKSSKKAYEALDKMGVDIWLNTRVTDYDGENVMCNSGKVLSGATLIWAAGVKGVVPNGIPESAIKGGRILVDAQSQMVGSDSIFSIGDVSAMITEAYPIGLPMVAQPAMQQGAHLAKNFKNKIAGKEMKPFVYKDLGSMATIGRNKAVTELPRFNLFGWIAWMAWLLVHVYQLVGFRNKIVVLINWAQNYFRHSRDLRLIIRPFQRRE
ncbi:MAG: NAD(P)/FAD-dependent oxidoreductase [Flavobacteriales bacterium]